MKRSLTYLHKLALGLAAAAALAIPSLPSTRHDQPVAHLSIPAQTLIADGTETHGLLPPPPKTA